MTEELKFALQFIEATKITRAEWRRNGRAAYGPPEKWNEFKIGSKTASLTISLDTQIALRELTKLGPIDETMFVLNEKGKTELKRLSK